ncbi:MAG: hypothetical protein PVF76_14080 [Syntrophobacterales bacterium]
MGHGVEWYDPPASPEGEADGGQARRWGDTETRRQFNRQIAASSRQPTA